MLTIDVWLCEKDKSVKGKFVKRIRYWIGSCEQVDFWPNKQVGNSALASQFLLFFRCAQDRQAKVSSQVKRIESQIVWSTAAPLLEEISHNQRKSSCFFSFESHQPGTFRPKGSNMKIWKGPSNRSFSVSSFFSLLTQRPFVVTPLCSLWSMKAPPRVDVFARIAFYGGVPLMDKLHKRRKIVIH